MADRQWRRPASSNWSKWVNAVAAVLFGGSSVAQFVQGDRRSGWVYAGIAAMALLLTQVKLDNPTHLRLSNSLIALLSGAAVVALIVLAVLGRGNLGSQIGLIILLLPFFIASTWVAVRGPAEIPLHQRNEP
jgi:hypothetical protein